jgi:hypothetical protein
MDKKTDKRPRSRGLSNLQSAGEDLQKTVNKKNIEFSTENNIPFSFTLDRNLVLFIKELVLKNEEYCNNFQFSILYLIYLHQEIDFLLLDNLQIV